MCEEHNDAEEMARRFYDEGGGCLVRYYVQWDDIPRLAFLAVGGGGHYRVLEAAIANFQRHAGPLPIEQRPQCLLCEERLEDPPAVYVVAVPLCDAPTVTQVSGVCDRCHDLFGASRIEAAINVTMSKRNPGERELGPISPAGHA